MPAHVPFLAYAVPALALCAALLPRLPGIVRAWRDPGTRDLRAVAGVLALALCVFVVAAPRALAFENRLLGVPNIAAPLTYTVLTCFDAACLALLITWREGASARRRRKIRRVWGGYACVVAGLWVTFGLADMRVERLRDLDTYYANTPWAREHIVLYLLGHTAGVLAAIRLIAAWVGTVRRRLRAGLVAMLAGQLLGLAYDIAKFTAVVARWAGRDADWLSTVLAPPLAAGCAVLVALGFLLPQAAPHLAACRRARRSYRALGPLWRTLRPLGPGPVLARVGWWSPYELRLLRRQSEISDGLLRLAPCLDAELRGRVRAQARSAGHADAEARGIAGAADILDAMVRYRVEGPADGARATALSEDFRAVEPVSLALRRPAVVARCLRAAGRSVPADHE
ncbi:MAB_1171c family putative transporter [Streptomyces sp. NPDC050560]|uniref:MAB_1171c family putative transporter n=1 Tax=Streptomyces sp. NPDC050560 TaxID=3365630 RepID=UPI0037AEEF7D